MKWCEAEQSSCFTCSLQVAVVVGVDVLFFRHHLWDQLIVNIGIVLVFAVLFQVPQASMSAAAAPRAGGSRVTSPTT